VTSTLIGARRLAQLEDNLKALDVSLSAEEFDRLDALTKPTFGSRRACSGGLRPSTTPVPQ
jgi:aryl-alcohol dehydrogenase-like predicted oxidoreductase